MPRPFKKRVVCSPPGVTVYKPAGVPARDLNWITMTIDEYEAVRLADHEGLDQEAAASLMQVSRQTYGRILAAARHIVGEALITGKAITVAGGNYAMRRRGGGRRRGRHGRMRRRE